MKNHQLMFVFLIFIFVAFSCSEDENSQNLHITVEGFSYEKNDKTLIAQLLSDTGGSTSIRNNTGDHLIWKSQGYYQRNRDLGQVFHLTDSQNIEAVILRTGPSDKAILDGAPGSEMFVQFFKVDGDPRINDNGTPVGTDAEHGFSNNHRCDDFIEGITYEPIVRYDGGQLPDIPPTFSVEEATGDTTGNMLFIRFSFKPEIKLSPGRYAFMVGFTSPGVRRGMTFANANRASMSDAPQLGDQHDLYKGGWGLRREGNGLIPPTMTDSEKEPEEISDRNLLKSESLFPKGEARYNITPATDGYPDVDTYRDLTFAIEVSG